ncbi:MAG: branched-chain amino acid ABC transporter permease [Salaquimonas sp.]|nr:branched-chain amino acid ABC transporter permease [Salaquimonas sp.]
MENLLNAVVLAANYLVIPATTYGCQIALGALGVTLIFSVLRFSNFAHGEMMSFGTMITIFTVWGLQAAGISIQPLSTALLALPVSIAATIAVTLLTDRWVYRFYRVRRVEPIIMVIVSAGLMFFFSGLTRFVIGPEDRNFDDGVRFIISAREFKERTGLAEGMSFRTTQAATIIVAVACVALLFWFLERTRTGKTMRAYADNEDLALLSGIDPEKVVMLAWTIAASLAAIAGTLYGMDKSYKPFVYQELLMPIFAAAIAGGFGNPLGAIAGGFLVAFSEVALTYPYKRLVSYLVPPSWQPDGLLQFLATDYKYAISFFILIIVLFTRPTGLLGKRSA